MEVRRAMIREIHLDDDAVEAAYRWHVKTVSSAANRVNLTHTAPSRTVNSRGLAPAGPACPPKMEAHSTT
jgi:hypothetical protein